MCAARNAAAIAAMATDAVEHALARMRTHDAGYYAHVEAGAKSTAVKPSAVHGAGLFATRAFKEGDVVFRERPLVAMQDLANKREVVACSCCLKFIDLGTELLRLVKDEPHGRKSAHDAVVQVPRGGPEGWCCTAKCGELYCSEACRDEHVRRGHRCLCVGHVSDEDAENDPLVQYKILAAQSNEILLLAAEVAVLWLGNGKEAFASFVREPWDEVVTTAATLRGEDAPTELAASLRELCADAAPLLRRALEPHFREKARVIDAAWLARVIGTFEQNNIGIRRRHPLDSNAEEAEEEWPPLEGTSLYSAACRANHSCAPSCDVIYAEGGHLCVSLVALRDIPAGDELTIAYVDTDECAEERRAATADYGFLCACPKCAGVA